MFVNKSLCGLLLLVLILSQTIISRAQIVEQYKHEKFFTKGNLNPGVGSEVFSNKNLLIIGGTLGVAFLLDEHIKDGMRDLQGNFGDNFTDVVDGFGDGNLVMPAQLGSLALSFVIKDERLSFTTMNSIKAVVIGGVLAEGMNKVAGRSRPFLNRGSMHFDFCGGHRSSLQSFPSGHSFVAWASLTPFAEEYSKWIYLLPAAVSFSRMYKNKHWLSDVVMGGAMGYLAGKYFQKRKNQRIIFNGSGITITF